jgi:hypothetical protein
MDEEDNKQIRTGAWQADEKKHTVLQKLATLANDQVLKSTQSHEACLQYDTIDHRVAIHLFLPACRQHQACGQREEGS